MREIRFIRATPVEGVRRVLDGETGEKLIKLQCVQIRRKYKLPHEGIEKRI